MEFCLFFHYKESFFCNGEFYLICYGVIGLHCILYVGCNYCIMEFGENCNVNIC
jgi:hypothetical protein